MSAQRATRSARAQSGTARAASKSKAEQAGETTRRKAPSKAAGGRGSSGASKTKASKAAGAKAPATKAGNGPKRTSAASKGPASRKRGFAAASRSTKSAQTKAKASGGIVRRAIGAFVRSYLVRFVAVLATVVAAVFIVVSAVSAQSGVPEGQRADGLPIYITDEMIDAARAMQHEYGHPAGCTIAQIIQESGQGTSLSMLAERDNNLFGMKWSDSFSGKHGVVGPVQWGTTEEYDGESVSIDASFIAFESKEACIEFRSSVFLQASTYADNPTIRRAVETRNSALMAWGLQDAGWATDSSYAESLVAIMDRYDLYRFDSST